MIRKNPISA